MGKSKVEEFKKFIVKHPAIIKEVRDHQKTWKEVYKDWATLGEDHEIWQRGMKEENKKNDQAKSSAKQKSEKKTDQEKKRKELTVGEIVSMLGKINVSDLQQYISQFGGAVEGIQQLIQHFQSNPQVPTAAEREKAASFQTFQTYKD
ncbi:spore coat protein YlbD [Fictibacillus iocasae]|uniref:Spore coat protein YlbD n=1 Tax=Fictibacillus iocasae TaxID=2715437 RepID=A0ABW2NN40_9BACL